MRTVFMFSGMGSQYFQMGRELFEQHPGFARWMRHYDARTVKSSGASVLEDLYADARARGDDFSDLKRGSAALLTLQCALARTLMDEDLAPDLLLGTSLGETAAGIIAGALDFEQMQALFRQHTDAITATCEPASLLGILKSEAWVRDDAFLRTRCELAACNFDGYVAVVVRDGHRHEVGAYLESLGVVSQPIAVGQGFHSSLIDPAEALCRQALAAVVPSSPTLPVISCATTRPVDCFDAAHLWSVLRNPILFQQSLQALDTPETVYVDVGPSGTLATYARAVLGRAEAHRVFPILTMSSRDMRNFLGLRQAMHTRRTRKGAHMKAVVFAGQGAQQKGMGRDLFKAFPVLTEHANDILGYDVRELCLEDPRKQLSRTQYTQPALFVVGALAYLQWREHTGRAPDAAAGHSLGEYNALFAAGAFDFETGVRLVQKRGALMAAVDGGAMAAVIGPDEETLRDVLRTRRLDSLDVANLNTPRQTVLSGPPEDIERAQSFLEAVGARYVRLNVSAAFHSRYMEPVAREFAAFLSTQPLRDPAFPVLANATARPHAPGALVANLAAQLCSPVRWYECVRFLRSLGGMDIEELGNTQVLTRMLSEIDAASPPVELPRERVALQPVPSVPLGLVSAPPSARKEEPARSPLTPGSALGDAAFRDEHGVRYAYYTGPMGKGVSGVELVSRLARSGILGVLGSWGLPAAQVEADIAEVRRRAGAHAAFAVDLRAGANEAERVRLLLRCGVRVIEASDHVRITPALVLYRLKGVSRGPDGVVRAPHGIIAKTSRLEMAERFLAPPPAELVAELVEAGQLRRDEAQLAPGLSMASDLCVRADCAATTEQGAALALFPVFERLRQRQLHPGARGVRMGLAGGIGSPVGAAAAFMMGADFISTGSINQCTVEAATSERVKDLLANASIHDTAYVPDTSSFELGGRAQVLKRGLFFPARANKLHDVYRENPSLEDLSPETRRMLEERWFGEPLGHVWARVAAELPEESRALAERNPKSRMALVFRAYLDRAFDSARDGVAQQQTQFHIPCGPAMGAANAWLEGGPFASWRNRHVDALAVLLMDESAALLGQGATVDAPRRQRDVG
ncbi:ACP S-malonyltransferase [Corallococcus sp. bb12-1]|uniref:ACP S-malonyltransferase n=1 Tax=Corallococcus sp. bb12-1 TaxID=2996784 RepID=UPI00226DFE9D|nr:ACP S-malonyltransferase [Corallococcus sp. bb12-1]MCY1042394.1 ACP S-malonyltransferase [Corallococcus sp. bb12-1]